MKLHAPTQKHNGCRTISDKGFPEGNASNVIFLRSVSCRLCNSLVVIKLRETSSRKKFNLHSLAKLRLMVLSLERIRWHFTASPHKPSLRKWGFGFTQLSLQKPMLAVTQHCASSSAVFAKPHADCSLMLSTLLSLLLLQGNQHSDFLKSVPVSFPKNWRRLPCDVKAKPLKCQEGQEVPVAPTQPCTKSPARAKQKLFALFWRNITVLLVVTPWASSLWRLRRALQLGTAGTRGLQGWRWSAGSGPLQPAGSESEWPVKGMGYGLHLIAPLLHPFFFNLR